MSFEWNRIHKWEENIERDVTDAVEQQIMEHYSVDDITTLTEEQMNEVMAFREELNEYSVMQWGFSNIYSQWEMENM
jgi:hypothetical protein